MRVKVSKICWAFVIQYACVTQSIANAFITTNKIPQTSLSTGYQASISSLRTIGNRRRPSFGVVANDIRLSNQSSNDNGEKGIKNNTQRRFQNQQQYRQQRGKNQQTRNKLESSLSNLFDISQGKKKKQRVREQSDMLQQIGVTADRSFSNAPKLDENVYVNSDKYVDEDGSIIGQEKSKIDDDMQDLRSVLMSDSPSIPIGTNNNDQNLPNSKSRGKNAKIGNGNIIDDQSLLESLTEAQNNAQNALNGDELHQRVFADEKGFLEQSEAFRETLSSDDNEKKETENEAVAWRRGADYRRRQEEAMALIEKEMEELENSALSVEDARELAAKENDGNEDANGFFFAHADSNGNGNANANINGDINTGNSQPTTILCSKCSSLMRHDEIVVERKRGRPNSNQMICRFCQVDSMRQRHASPYLMGRLGKNGKPPPRTGMDEIAPTKNKVIRKNVDKIRNMGPRTEDLTTDEIRGNGDDISIDGGGSQRTEAQSIAWREHFMSAMTNRRPATTKTGSGAGANIVELRNDKRVSNQTTSDVSTKNQKNLMSRPPLPQENQGGRDQITSKNMPVKQNTNSTSHRYSSRLQYLEKIKTQNPHNDRVSDALHKAALHRQQGIEQTGIAHQTKDPNINKPVESKNQLSPSSSGVNSSELNKANDEIRKLQARIMKLEGTADEYLQQLQKSSKQVQALQSMMNGMNYTKPVKRKQPPRKSKSKPGSKNVVGDGLDNEHYLDDP
jgi:hypothetical protein